MLAGEKNIIIMLTSNKVDEFLFLCGDAWLELDESFRELTSLIIR